MEYKGYMVVPSRVGATIEVKTKGSGKLPEVLRGLYTGRGQAYKSIDGYLNGLLKGKNSNAATKNTRSA